MENFNAISREYDKSLEDNKKKELGIFYTDTEMTEMIMNEISIKPENTIIDPCCGTGSFLFTLKNNGISEKNIYGADIDK